MMKNPALSQVLRDELQRSQMGVRKLAKAVQARLERDGIECRGRTYSGIRAVVSGEIRRPRTEILSAIAEVLGVSPEYLASGGKGERTKEQRTAATQVQPDPFQTNPILKSVHRHFSRIIDLDRLALGPVIDSGIKLADAMLLEPWINDVKEADVGKRLGEILQYPIEQLEVDKRRIPAEALKRYVLAMCLALDTLYEVKRSMLARLALVDSLGGLPTDEAEERNG